jgi:hypothetical protein
MLLVHWDIFSWRLCWIGQVCPEEDDCGVPWVFQLIHNLEILTVKTQKIIN